MFGPFHTVRISRMEVTDAYIAHTHIHTYAHTHTRMANAPAQVGKNRELVTFPVQSFLPVTAH